ncbi:MAG TPA: hypothetical protein DCS97_05720 [Planctomycetes bacterium]|nr:hypothetical protein [Planctomycetota bacterium]
MRLLSVLLLIACAGLLHAVQLQDLDLVSPITGQRFVTVATASQGGMAPGPADMGTDVDGCRHSSGPCEYDFYIAVDPHSYFAALSSEWEARDGKFIGEVSPATIEWLRKEYTSEREIDWNRAYQYALQIARSTGQQPPDRKTFAIPQNSVPLEKRYRLALASYEHRGARRAVLAKIALTGAWSIRCRVQMPVSHQSLAGGFEEVNDRIARQIKDGEAFDLAKWTKAYRTIVDDDGLTREGYTVASMALFGFLMREGDLQGCQELITKAGERLGRDDKPDVLRGLVRDRKRMLEEHNKLLGVAAENFVGALRNEEFVRTRIPEVLLVVGEAYRRLGFTDRAIDWFTALGRLPETQPASREALRFEGKMRALPADKPYHVQLGWIADEQRQRLQRTGSANAGEMTGPDRAVLIAIVNEGLGTAAFNAPGWKPASGATQTDCAIVLDQVGKGVLEHAFRLGGWPKNLGELWEREIVRDRNRVNRFHCPVTGQKLLYSEPPGDVSSIAASTVLVATSAPIDTAQGPRYGAFCANARVMWLAQAPVIGQPLPAQP